MLPRSAPEFFSLAMWLAGVGHFVLLFASFQVPYRLEWKRDLVKLTPFNRKLMWVYGGFVVYTIVAFGILTLALHQELLRGDRSALALAVFIGVYWLLRTVVDFTYYSHSDWPQGRAVAVGRILLTLLFVLLAAAYLSLFAWRTWFR